MTPEAKLERVFEATQRLNRGIDDELSAKIDEVIEWLIELKQAGHHTFNNHEYKAILGALGAMRHAKTFVLGWSFDEAFVKIWAATELLHSALCSYQSIEPQDAPTLEMSFSDIKQIIAQQSVPFGLPH